MPKLKPHDHKRVRHQLRRFAQANGKRAFLFAAAAGK